MPPHRGGNIYQKYSSYSYFLGEIHEINTCTKISLSKTRKSMPRKLVPLKFFLLYGCIYVALDLLYTISELY